MSIRQDFPILSRTVRDAELVYLDSAATTQKPGQVIDAVAQYYERHNANVHRAAHALADEATTMLEQARAEVASLINAPSERDIIFTRGTTEAINLVAACLPGVLSPQLSAADEILITTLEHHSNIVPWQQLAQRTGATLVAVDVLPSGDLDLDDFARKLSSRTRIFSCGHVSNALGTVNPIQHLLDSAKAQGAITVVDGAQAMLHQHVDVQALNCDFYAFSGHKMLAPTGIGVLFGKSDLLEAMPPWQGGGEMIEHVTLEQSTYQKPPYKFEAGTPHIAGIVGLGAAIEYLNQIPMDDLIQAESKLVQRAVNRLKQIPEITLVGEPEERSSVISFNVAGGHAHDIGTLLDQQGVAVRTGHHCTMPLMQALGVSGTVRASFSLYSNESDVDRLVAGIEKSLTFL